METIGQYLNSQKRTYVVRETYKSAYCRPLIDNNHIITPKEVLKRVSERLNIPIEVITGKCRKTEIQDAAKIVTYLLRFQLQMKYREITEVIGRDHTTLIHRIKEHENLLFSSRKYRDKFEKCKY